MVQRQLNAAAVHCDFNARACRSLGRRSRGAGRSSIRSSRVPKKLLIVGVLYLVPVAREIVISLLNVNVYVAGLNIIIGIITLTTARVSGPERVVPVQGSST
jgi:hypothetical protein